jgi:hypothetical protein
MSDEKTMGQVIQIAEARGSADRDIPSPAFRCLNRGKPRRLGGQLSELLDWKSPHCRGARVPRRHNGRDKFHHSAMKQTPVDR